MARTLSATGYVRPRLTGTIVLQSDNGVQATSGDPRNTTFSFDHDTLFRGFGSLIDLDDYVGFRLSISNVAIKNTATAPSSTGNSLVNVLLFPNNAPLVSGNSNGIARNACLMARFTLSTTASAWSMYYNTTASEYILPFLNGQTYVWQIALTTGVLSTDVYNLTGGYQPTAYSLSVAIELIPKEPTQG